MTVIEHHETIGLDRELLVGTGRGSHRPLSPPPHRLYSSPASAPTPTGENVLIFETPVAYRTVLADMDAKEFGLPQTRQRKYMLIWQPEQYPDGVDVAELWQDPLPTAFRDAINPSTMVMSRSITVIVTQARPRRLLRPRSGAQNRYGARVPHC